jgi:hypothetical protein
MPKLQNRRDTCAPNSICMKWHIAEH